LTPVETEQTGHLRDEGATLAFGARLGATLGPGTIIFLSGNLGSGKTTLARGILRGLGYDGKVKSPTYTLVELYKLSRLDLYHFDLYRFNDPQEWADAGFRDSFGSGNVCLVEWPERGGDLLPRPDLRIELSVEREGRRIRVCADSESGRNCLKQLQV